MSNQTFDFTPDFRPLAARMRPRTLAEYTGQDHILGPEKPLRRALERGVLHSMILWGPPGTGKTTLASLIAANAQAEFVTLSAVTSGVKDIRSAIEAAQMSGAEHHRRTVLFVDEVHRFNKGQQDAFLPYIEDGTIIFVGTTTENPAFELNRALLSRARIYRLQSLTESVITELVTTALNDAERGLGERKLQIEADALEFLVASAAGDARRALNFLEIAADAAETVTIQLNLVQQAVGKKHASYDKRGDAFFDILSALHKSVRGSSVDGALYWYARVLEGGGDALVVARRLLAIASEDIGNADPRALQLALNAWDTFERVGPAEGERAIAQALVYCCLAPKSNAVYVAFKAAKRAAADYPDSAVPKHLCNAPTSVHKELGHGVDYRYAHDFPNAVVPGERYIPSELGRPDFYQPSERGLEKQLRAKSNWLREQDQTSDWKRDDDN
ncbi:recombination factor protein RarA [Pseudidiomarina aestuarii]|nr:recombination factor protein RarA [Pseudidiomarina aestuarii]